MKPSSEEPLDRLDVLLAESMIRPLDADEIAELDELAGADGDLLLSEAEQAAITLQLGYANEGDVEAMPQGLRDKLRQEAPQVTPSSQQGPKATERSNNRSWSPWIMVAAALFVIISYLPKTETPPTELRLELLAAAPKDLIELDWTVLEDPSSIDATGSLTWSGERQEGYMVFDGLAVNDPSVEQYQLWIFDDATDTRYPVDGGVFDIPEGGGRVIIPIDPKIRVRDAFQFAITVERPGGVVVSERERIPLLAAKP